MEKERKKLKGTREQRVARTADQRAALKHANTQHTRRHTTTISSQPAMPSVDRSKVGYRGRMGQLDAFHAVSQHVILIHLVDHGDYLMIDLAIPPTLLHTPSNA